MKLSLAGALMCSAIIGVIALTPSAIAKTAKECRAEWTANKAANQAKGITQKAYVEECRAGTTAMKPAATPAAAPAQTKMTPPASAPAQTKMAPPAAEKMAPPTTAPAKPTTARTEPAPATGKPAGANQFAAEGGAKAHCPTGLVVWANLDSKIYHFSGHADYGHTKEGAYMCEKDAMSQGMRAAKNEKRPGS